MRALATFVEYGLSFFFSRLGVLQRLTNAILGAPQEPHFDGKVDRTPRPEILGHSADSALNTSETSCRVEGGAEDAT